MKGNLNSLLSYKFKFKIFIPNNYVGISVPFAAYSLKSYTV